MTASECHVLRLNITGLGVGKSAAYKRISAGDIQGYLGIKSRLIMQLCGISYLSTNQGVGSSNLSGRASFSCVYSDGIGDDLYRRHG
jgi:hypothetical protein